MSLGCQCKSETCDDQKELSQECQKMDLAFKGKLMHENFKIISLWDGKLGMRHAVTDENRICLWDAKIKPRNGGTKKICR
jgi:hypothetical protein